jgi:hypothetical protein
MSIQSNKCPDCNVSIGSLHQVSCDVERCPCCGGQALSCEGFNPDDPRRMPWTGEWPGVAECREFGWYAIFKNGWQSVDPSTPGATPNLNRLYTDGQWDAKAQRFRQRSLAR